MQKIILVAFYVIVFTSQIIYSQKVHFETIEIPIKRLLPPIINISAGNLNYNINVNGFIKKDLENFNIDSNLLINKLKISNFILDSQNPDFTIEAIISSVTGSPLNKININPSKPGEQMRYAYEINILGDLRINLNSNNKELKNYKFNYDKIIRSKTFTSWKEASEYFQNNDNSEEFYFNGRKDGLLNLFQQANKQLNRDFGYSEVNLKNKFYILSEKKHPEYLDFKNINEELLFATKKMEYESLDSFKKYTNVVIDFWKNKSSSYSVGDSEQKKLIFLCNYNLSKIYLLREEFEVAKKYAQMIKEGGFMQFESNKLLEDISKTELDFKTRNVNTNYIELRRSDDEKQLIASKKKEYLETLNSGKLTELPEFNELLEVNDKSIIDNFLVHLINGSKIKGYLVYEKTSNRVDLRNLAKMRFGYAKNGLLIRSDLSQIKFDSILIAKSMYYFAKENDPKVSNLKFDIDGRMLHDVHEFQKTKIIQFFLCCYDKYEIMNNTNPDNVVYTAIYNKITKKYSELDGLKSYTKYLKGVILGCPAAEKYVDGLIEEASKLSFIEKMKEKIDYNKVKTALELFDSCN